MKVVLGVVSVVAGYLLATLAVTALHIAGLNIPAALARTYTQYNTYVGVEVLVFLIVFSVLLYRVVGRRVFHWKPDTRPVSERLPIWMRHPSLIGLVIAWVVAVFTFVVYPVAIYMSWRAYQDWRVGHKTCPRCAERIKTAAVVCRHCGHDLAAVQALG